MERESHEERQVVSPLLVINEEGGGDRRSESSATAVVVLSTFIAVCGSFVFGAAVGYSSPAESGIMDDLSISVAQYSVFGSILTIGAMLGAVTSGKIADLIGRKGTMGISGIFCTVGWLAIAFSKGAWTLDLGRLTTGCGIGLLSYVVPVYIAEITPKNLRGGFTAVHQVMLTCGSSLMFFVGTVVRWRNLALIATIPSLVQLLGLFFIPESPRWLENIGREKECEAALQRIRGASFDISHEADEIRKYTETLKELPEDKILELFQRKYSHSLIVALGLMVLQQFGGSNGIGFYASSIFESAGFSEKVGTIAMAIAQIPTTILGVFLVDNSGRRLLLMISAAGACFGCFLVGLSFLLQDFERLKEITPIMVFIGILVFNASFGLGIAGIPWLIMSEIFPINMKGSAGSVVSLVNWLCSWLVTFIFNFLMHWSSAGTFLVFSCVGGVTIVFVAKLVPETRGRTLEEIQAAMNPSASRS